MDLAGRQCTSIPSLHIISLKGYSLAFIYKTRVISIVLKTLLSIEWTLLRRQWKIIPFSFHKTHKWHCSTSDHTWIFVLSLSELPVCRSPAKPSWLLQQTCTWGDLGTTFEGCWRAPAGEEVVVVEKGKHTLKKLKLQHYTYVKTGVTACWCCCQGERMVWREVWCVLRLDRLQKVLSICIYIEFLLMEDMKTLSVGKK